MKKRLSCALILALTTGLLISCGSKDGSVSNAGGNGAAGSAKEIVLGHVYAEDHNINRASLQFKDYIEKESGGSMTVNIQPNSVLGGAFCGLFGNLCGRLGCVEPPLFV